MFSSPVPAIRAAAVTSAAAGPCRTAVSVLQTAAVASEPSLVANAGLQTTAVATARAACLAAHTTRRGVATPAVDTASASSLWRDEPDAYPTRVVRPKVLPRVDPVVADPEASGPLSSAQLRDFEERGVITVRGLFDDGEVEALQGALARLKDHYEAMPYDQLDAATDMRVVSERGGGLAGDGGETPILKQIWNVAADPHSPEASHLVDGAGEVTHRALSNARVVSVAEQILGDRVFFHQSRINYQPGVSETNLRGGSGFLWHQVSGCVVCVGCLWCEYYKM